MLKDAEAASLYRGEIDTDNQVTLQQIGRAAGSGGGNRARVRLFFVDGFFAYS